MLYAELHGKLDPIAPDLERREDILTSTIFGTLLVAAEPELLTRWFNSARCLGSDGRLTCDGASLGLESDDPVSFWFWPSLSEAQPDVLLRIGSHLLVVEAKYASGKSHAPAKQADSSDIPGPVADSDQLLREWQSVQRNAKGLEWYPSDIRSAIEACQGHVVYLVSARSEFTALRELCASQRKIRNAVGGEFPMWLLTWQDLHAVLFHRRAFEPKAPSWVADLARLLERRHLAAFLGFPQILVAWKEPSPSIERWASSWWHDSVSAMAAEFERVGLEQFHRAVAIVEAWAAVRRKADTPYFAAIDRLDVDAMSQVAEYLSARFWLHQG